MMKKPRGFGRIYQPTYRDKRTGERKVSAVYWIRYWFRGLEHAESSGSVRYAHALALLRRRQAEMGQGRLVGPDVERTLFDDLAEMLLTDYRINMRRSLDRMEGAIGHLGETFGGMRALDITADRIAAYVERRQTEGAANATINRELAALKRMFRLGEWAGRVVGRPHIALLREDNVRTGFFEAEQFRAVLARLPGDLKPVFEIAYVTGWRVRSEILTRQWRHVDFAAGWLRLEPGETKNGEGRQFPLTPELQAVLDRQHERTRAQERVAGRIIPWVFHRGGEPIKSFRRAWLTACKLAGVPGRIPHDFRRTAARNLERAGVARSAAMKMVGHRTESIYRRYAIAEEGMLREAGVKLAALHQAERERLQAQKNQESTGKVSGE